MLEHWGKKGWVRSQSCRFVYWADYLDEAEEFTSVVCLGAEERSRREVEVEI